MVEYQQILWEALAYGEIYNKNLNMVAPYKAQKYKTFYFSHACNRSNNYMNSSDCAFDSQRVRSYGQNYVPRSS